MTSSGIARPDQQKHAPAIAPGTVQKRFHGITAKVRVDRQGVGVPDRVKAVAQAHPGEGRVGIGRGGTGNVIAFAVEDGEQAALAGMAQDLLQGRQPRRSAGLEKGALRLDHGDQGRHEIDNSSTKLREGLGCAFEGPIVVPRASARGKASQRGSSPTHRALPLARHASVSRSAKCCMFRVVVNLGSAAGHRDFAGETTRGNGAWCRKTPRARRHRLAGSRRPDRGAPVDVGDCHSRRPQSVDLLLGGRLPVRHQGQDIDGHRGQSGRPGVAIHLLQH